jgi:hypothetical protein
MTRTQGVRLNTVLIVIAMWLLASVLGASTAFATHWTTHGWYHEHKNYPNRPDGLSALNNVFGTRCTTPKDNANQILWRGEVSGGSLQSFPLNFHKFLGGASTNGFWPTPFPNVGSTVVEDVYGHLEDDHRNYPYTSSTAGVKGGIYGYLCRQISGSDKWSVHSWGVAIDINASWESYPDPDCQPNSFGSLVSNKFTNHNFYWAANFPAGSCDPMHFQYVTGY